LWSGGKIVDLGTLGGDETAPFGVNEKGQVVGWSTAHGGVRHAFLWENGNMTDLGRGQAVAINVHGQIVGLSGVAGAARRASLWQNGKRTDLGTLGGKVSEAVNDRGEIVGISTTAKREQGWHAFMWKDGHMTDLGTLPGGSSSMVHAINEQGQVIGWSFPTTGEAHAVLWQEGTTTDLGETGPNSYRYDSFSLGINDRGEIVGRIGEREELGRDEAMRAFVWQHGSRTLLPTLGGRQTIATAINDRGQIVGSSTTKTGSKHAVLWTPRP
jgi:probable HAF family extracellular repeat protein